MARQQLLLLSAVMAMVLFAVVTIPTDIRHALSSDQPLSWTVAVVVYAALVAHRRFPLGTVAVATIGSVVLMAAGMAYPLTLPAVFYVLYWVAQVPARSGRSRSASPSRRRCSPPRSSPIPASRASSSCCGQPWR